MGKGKKKPRWESPLAKAKRINDKAWADLHALRESLRVYEGASGWRRFWDWRIIRDLRRDVEKQRAYCGKTQDRYNKLLDDYND